MAQKPHLSFWQIWNMSFGFLGIQFGFALQNANVSRIFQTLGAEIDSLSILWIAAPVTGLIVQPIIGHYSDNTWGKFGRRRPYFLFGAIAASIALLIMPNSPVLWIAVGMLWIMDASINISMEPFRAFVGDMLPDEQRTAGFAMQSFFIGTGAVIASALPWMMTNWLGIDNTAPEGQIPPSVKFSFYFGAIVFLLAVLWTVFRTREYSPEELASFEEHEKKMEEKPVAEPVVMDHRARGRKQIINGFIWLLVGAALATWFYLAGIEKEPFVLAYGLAGLGVIMMISGVLQRQGRTSMSMVVIVNDIMSMPKTMLHLALVQFFSWFALFAMWIYTVPAITQYIYGSSDPTSQAYNDGADWVTILFAVYNGVAALVAWLLSPMAKATNRKVTHLICLFLGGFGLLSIYFIKDPNMLILSMVGVGFAWAGILSIPYAILTNSLPANKMGVYMGIFNFFIVIPQIIAAAILGFFLKSFFANEAIYAMIIGGISMFLAGILIMFVKDRQ
ncbi:MAG: MFS transporter [Bacteroidales bacterium]|jgi:maltose/moltooligosaccharide transporter|nr:MFS transporter [Bacteroidales bacterium]